MELLCFFGALPVPFNLRLQFLSLRFGAFKFALRFVSQFFGSGAVSAAFLAQLAPVRFALPSVSLPVGQIFL